MERKKEREKEEKKKRKKERKRERKEKKRKKRKKKRKKEDPTTTRLPPPIVGTHAAVDTANLRSNIAHLFEGKKERKKEDKEHREK